MRRSTITWHLTFARDPRPAEVGRVSELLAPIERAAHAPDFGAAFRDMGLCPWDLVGPAVERGAGELARDCLVAAHRLGTGWSVMWPATGARVEGGYYAADLDRAARPECLDGLVGMLPVGTPAGRFLVPDLVGASFAVAVLAEAAPPRP